MKLENLGPGSTELPQLYVLQHALPGVVGPGHDPARVSVPNAGETATLLRNQATRPFKITRGVFRFGVFPLGVLWFGLSILGVLMLYEQFYEQVEKFAAI